MRNGISGAPVPYTVPFAAEIAAACEQAEFFPCLVSAIQHNETGGLSELDAESVVSNDGGHGVMQLTAEYPPNWAIPFANILYAIDNFLEPAETYWAKEVQGDALVRCIAAEYNAGRGGALRGHEEGDVDKYTTNRYADRALARYLELTKGTPNG